MNNSREKICDILDETLNTLKQFEEEPLNNQCSVGNSMVGSSTSLKDKVSSNRAEKTAISSSVSKDSNERPILSGKRDKKRSWKKPKDKPKRPLSAYNLFFRHERENIISGGTAANSLSKNEILAFIKAKKKLQQPKGKRLNRKCHRKISFEELARSIADKWKTIDKGTRAIFEKEADQEKLRYKKELEEWNRKRDEKNTPITNPFAPAPQETERLLGLTASVGNMIGSTNKPILTACIPQMNNPTIFPNHPYYSEYKAYIENIISQQQMQIFREEMYPCASMGPFPPHERYNYYSYAQKNNPHGYDYDQSCNCAFVSCAHKHSCHMSSARRTCQHACDMLPVAMNNFHGTCAGNSPQPCASCCTDKFNTEEFVRYYPINEPSNDRPVASFGDDEASMISTNSADYDESSRSLQDDIDFFMKTL